jgi:molybdenum cofactor cytidylyltransferase
MSKVVMKQHINLVLLAAGQSRRFNGIKLAQSITDTNNKGETVTQALLLHSLDKLNCLSLYLTSLNISNEVMVILGGHQLQLKTLLPETTNTVFNPYSELGLSTSIKTAVEEAHNKHSTALLLALADHIGISDQDYKNLVDLWINKQHTVCAFYHNSFAVPAIFDHRQFSELSLLQGDQGAKPILNALANSNQLTSLSLPNGVYDIDTRDDIAHWQQQKIQR